MSNVDWVQLTLRRFLGLTLIFKKVVYSLFGMHLGFCFYVFRFIAFNESVFDVVF